MTDKQIQKLTKKAEAFIQEVDAALADPEPRSEVVGNGLIQARSTAVTLIKVLDNDRKVRSR